MSESNTAREVVASLQEAEVRAQQAGEARLALANEVLWADEMDVDAPEGWEQMAGPYCGCDTCMVREVLDAALPYMIDLFTLAHELQPDFRRRLLEDRP